MKTFKSGQVSESWIAALNDKFKGALEKAIANTHWLILPGVDANRFVFIIESDWSSRYADCMLFVSKDGGERLLDIGREFKTFLFPPTLVIWMPWYGHVNEPRPSEECYQ